MRGRIWVVAKSCASSRKAAAGVLDHHHAVAQGPAFADGGFHPHIGRHARDQHRLDPQPAQAGIQVRAEKGAPLALGDDQVGGERPRISGRRSAKSAGRSPRAGASVGPLGASFASGAEIHTHRDDPSAGGLQSLGQGHIAFDHRLDVMRQGAGVDRIPFCRSIITNAVLRGSSSRATTSPDGIICITARRRRARRVFLTHHDRQRLLLLLRHRRIGDAAPGHGRPGARQRHRRLRPRAGSGPHAREVPTGCAPTASPCIPRTDRA